MRSEYPNIPKQNPPCADVETRNVVSFWGFFSKRDLLMNPGSLLMLDVDFGRECSLRCPSCFRRQSLVDDDIHPDLTYLEILAVIDEARTLGMREVKICGAGEPLENPLLLQFARDLTSRGVGLAIFTKAHVFGDDSWVQRVFGNNGIRTARALSEAFYELKTSFLVGFQSAIPSVQDRLVGGIRGYSTLRRRALEILAETGFNKTSPTRLALCCNPMTKENVSELYDIYVFGRERNILPVNACLMVSGKQLDARYLAIHDAPVELKEYLFRRIYQYNVEHGITTIEQIEEEGISCMPGVHPCNQVAAGLYLTCNGNVVHCPGDSHALLGNVRETGITEIWHAQADWPLCGQFNCHCPFKDGTTLPVGIYDRTLKHLEAYRQEIATCA